MTAFPVRVGRRLERHLPHRRVHPLRRRLQRHPPGDHAGVPEAHRGGALALDVRPRARRRCASAALPTSASSSSCARPGRETIDVEIGYLFHPSALERPAVRAQAQAVRRRRAGLRAPGPGRHHQGAARAALPVRARGRYSWQEESHVQFNRWLVAALSPALAGDAGGDRTDRRRNGLTISPERREQGKLHATIIDSLLRPAAPRSC